MANEGKTISCFSRKVNEQSNIKAQKWKQNSANIKTASTGGGWINYTTSTASSQKMRM